MDIEIQKETQVLVYLRFAEAGGHQTPWGHIEVPLLPALVVRIQSWDPSIQGADDHERPVDRTQRHSLIRIYRHLIINNVFHFSGQSLQTWQIKCCPLMPSSLWGFNAITHKTHKGEGFFSGGADVVFLSLLLTPCLAIRVTFNCSQQHTCAMTNPILSAGLGGMLIKDMWADPRIIKTWPDIPHTQTYFHKEKY